MKFATSYFLVYLIGHSYLVCVSTANFIFSRMHYIRIGIIEDIVIIAYIESPLENLWKKGRNMNRYFYNMRNDSAENERFGKQKLLLIVFKMLCLL